MGSDIRKENAAGGTRKKGAAFFKIPGIQRGNCIFFQIQGL